jgi:hypothetical protein
VLAVHDLVEDNPLRRGSESVEEMVCGGRAWHAMRDERGWFVVGGHGML